jgi:glycogen(starch) synthase
MFRTVREPRSAVPGQSVRTHDAGTKAKPLRILHITPEYPPIIWGGLGTAVGGLVNASARAGSSVAVLLIGGVLVKGDGQQSYGSAPPMMQRGRKFNGLDSFVDREGVTFFHVAPHESIEAGIRLAEEWKPDVLHLHTAWFAPVANAIREKTGLPLVFTVHSLDRAEYEIGQLSCGWEEQDAMIRSATRVIALCGDERQLLSVYFPPEVLSRVRIVGNGIEDAPAAQAAAFRVRDGAKAPLILYTGRFVERKGIHDLLSAIPRVLERVPEAQFVLIGGYGGGVEIERQWMADTLRPYRANVRFTGWLTPDKVAEWYSVADILVVPSWYEPFGMVILEGMLYGLPIASTEVGGPAEILRHGRTALLFPSKDIGGLADCLVQLSSSSDLRRTLGRAAAEEVRRTWLWPQVVMRMEAVYRESAGHPAANGCGNRPSSLG